MSDAVRIVVALSSHRSLRRLFGWLLELASSCPLLLKGFLLGLLRLLMHGVFIFVDRWAILKLAKVFKDID